MIFKLNNLNILFKLVIGALVFLIIIFLTSEEIDWVLLMILFFSMFLFEVLMFFFGKRLVELSINKDLNEIVLVYRIFFFRMHTERIILNDVSFSFNEEVGGKGIKSKEFRIYVNNLKLFGIGRGFDGWEHKTIEDIIIVLRELGLNEIKSKE